MAQPFNWWKLFFSKEKDNRPKFGLGFYLILMIGFVAVLTYYLVGPRASSTAMVGQGVSASRLGRAVRETSAVEQPAAQSTLQSVRALPEVKEKTELAAEAAAANSVQTQSDSQPVREPRNALDLAVSDASQPVDRERRDNLKQRMLPGVINFGDGPRPESPLQEPSDGRAPRPLNIRNLGSADNDPATRQDGASALKANLDELIVYRRKTDTLQGPTASGAVQRGPQWVDGKFLPRGHIVPLYLLEYIRTDSQQPIVIFGVARDVRFHNQVVIPFGTRLLASVSGSPSNGTRVVATPSSFQFPDGRELSVAGIIKGSDTVTGLPGYYIPPPTWVQMSGYVNDFLSGYLALIYDRQQQLNRIQIGSVTLGASQPAFDPKLEAVNATSSVIKDFATKQMNELQARYAPYLVVPPGTAAEMVLVSPLSVQSAGYDVASSGARDGAAPAAAISSQPRDGVSTIERVTEQARQIGEAMVKTPTQGRQ